MPNSASNHEWDWRDLRRVAVHRRWYLLVPLCACVIAGALLPRLIQPKYQSEALIRIRQQQVPTKYVAPNVTTSAADRLQAIQQTVLSRARLQDLIENLNLYPHLRSAKTMDQLVDQMSKDITTTSISAPDRPNQLTGFKIAYVAPSPSVAKRVVDRLTSLFIADNLKARAAQSASTTSFLESQLQDAKAALDKRRADLSAYKEHYLGELPEQQQGNLEILSSLQTQYGADAQSLARAQQEKAYFESLETQYRSDAGQAAADPNSPQAKLQALETKLDALLATHTDKYPNVIATRREIKKWKALAAATPASSQASSDQPALIEAASRIQSLNLEIQSDKNDMAQLDKRIAAVQKGLNLTPVREQGLSALTQSYDDALKTYQSLLQRHQESQLATDLENSQQGERFELVDAANLPQEPVSPNPLLFLAGGWVLGLMLGGGSALGREYFDTTLASERAVGELTTVPVLACIPTLSSPGRRRRQLRLRVFEFAAGSCLLLAAIGLSIIPFWVG